MLEELAQHVETLLGSNCLSRRLSHGELTVIVPAEAILDVLRQLRDDDRCQFEQLIDICGVDYPEREKRFDLVYHLLSPRKNQRLRLKFEVCESTALPSVGDTLHCAHV